MSYYQKHVFICTNKREDDTKPCCANGGASTLFDYFKAQVKVLQLSGKGKFRINKAGCLDRCSEGPVLVIYPEGVWYHYETHADIDEIIEQHLILGKTVERLLLKD